MALDEIPFLITMEKTSQFPLFVLVDFFLCSTLLCRMQTFFRNFFFFFQSQLSPVNPKVKEDVQLQVSDTEVSHGESLSRENRYDAKLERDEVKMVMGNLGIFCSPESEELEERYGWGEISAMFEEEEPSLEEVKRAFDVFDENRDGFIDGRELQRVLCILGLKEATELENCQKMIATFDENGDGRIDFREFVKIMENNFH
ncbi:probable calcium-binding protein CML46 [Prosopis cineraria]|uniref:probable calcium-binding protein CML46 n=1 Tax=Prosopis cineraria TaxID=364024 RepID=UPI00240F79B0|nr:probable calcium-binding protein CML46 [Prosopis cineraria]